MLKIDLLPKHFGIARTNKRILMIGLVLLVVIGAVFAYKYNGVQAQIAQTKETIAKVEPIAVEVGKLENEISKKQGWLDPIKAKLDFVENADKTGEEYFDRFHSINKYIWEGAQMSSFSVNSGGGTAGGMGGMRTSGMMGPGTAQPTGGTASTVQFTVRVHGDAGVGRFLLNLLRCPDLTNIKYSGVPGGRSITASGAGAVTTATGGPLGMSDPRIMGPGMPGAAGLRERAAMPQGVGVEPGSPNEPITLQISATLTEPIAVPTPPSGGAAATAMGGMVGAMGSPGRVPMGDPRLPAAGDGGNVRPPPRG